MHKIVHQNTPIPLDCYTGMNHDPNPFHELRCLEILEKIPDFIASLAKNEVHLLSVGWKKDFLVLLNACMEDIDHFIPRASIL
jgi:hypothetical protein